MSISSEMKQTLGAIEACELEINNLKHRAVQGDALAAIALVEIGVTAARAVQALWAESPVYNPFRESAVSDDLAQRREALNFLFHDLKAFPTLYPGDPGQEAMLKEIEYGPFKKRRRKVTDAKTLLEDMVLPRFYRIKGAVKRPVGIDGRIWDLPRLSLSTSKIWTDVITAWLGEKFPAKLTAPNSWLYKLANPHLGLSKDKARRKTTLKRRIRKWMSEGDGDGEMSAIDKTWAEQEKKEIDAMSVTHAHIRNGFKAAIIKYFERNLEAR